MATLVLALVFALGVIHRECGVNHLEIQSLDLEEPLIGFFDSSCPAEKETPQLFPYGMFSDSMEPARFTIKEEHVTNVKCPHANRSAGRVCTGVKDAQCPPC